MPARSAALPVPIFVENDAAAAALGEMQFGLGQQYQSFFYILITAALGGGLVIDGHYFRGAAGRSGELGRSRRGGRYSALPGPFFADPLCINDAGHRNIT